MNAARPLWRRAVTPRALGAAFLGVVACGWWVAHTVPSMRGSATIVWHLALTVLMLLIWRWHCRQPAMAPLSGPLDVMWVGVLARLLLVALPVFTTHDAQRYLWDGVVALAGLDPYRLAPAAPEVAALRAQWPTPAEHVAYPTLYPPGALALFALAATAGPEAGLWVWKGLTTLAGLATLFVMRAVLACHGTLQHLPLLALSPLLLLETGVGAHVDAWSTLALALALWCWTADRPAWAGMALGLGVLVKLSPLLAALPLAVACCSRGPAGLRCAARLGAGLAVVVAAGYALAWMLGLQPLGSLLVFFSKWRGGSPLYAALEAMAAPDVAALAAVAMALALLGLAAWRARTHWVGGLQLALAAPLLFSPVVFPWYLCLLVPVLALQPRAWLLAWVSVVPLAYEVLDGFAGRGVWMPASWPLWVVTSAWLLGGAVDVWRVRAARRA